MNTLAKWLTVGLLGVALLSGSHAWAMGDRAEIVEQGSDEGTPAGIWYHTSAFYLRFSLRELGGQEDLHFLWAGFALEEGSESSFVGEVVVDDFGPDERRYPARAELTRETEAEIDFQIEVTNAEGKTIKQFLVRMFRH